LNSFALAFALRWRETQRWNQDFLLFPLSFFFGVFICRIWFQYLLDHVAITRQMWLVLPGCLDIQGLVSISPGPCGDQKTEVAASFSTVLEETKSDLETRNVG